MGPKGIRKKEPASIVRKVHEFLGDKLLESKPFSEGGSTRVDRSEMIVGGKHHQVVLKFWLEDLVLMSTVLNIHNNYITLKRLQDRHLISTLKVPILYRSFVETEEGLLVPLPAQSYVITSRPEMGAANNSLLVMEDISSGGAFQISDGLGKFQPEQMKKIFEEFEVIYLLMNGDESTKRMLLSLTILRKMSEPQEPYIGDIDKLGRLSFYPNIPIVELTDLVENAKLSFQNQDYRILEKPLQ